MEGTGFIIPPAFIMIFGALLLPFLGNAYRQAAIIMLPVLTLFAAWGVPEEADYIAHFAGFPLHPVYVHPFTLIFATVFCIAAFAGGVFGLSLVNKKKLSIAEMTAAYIYAGSAVGATFAGDYITLFIYWEIMAVASTVVVICGNSDGASKAAFRYAALHFIGGVVLLAGITAYITATHSADIGHIDFDIMSIFEKHVRLENIAAALILVGVLINAGAPPFSSWIPDAYPEGSPVGAVFLSAFTTKTSVFVLLTIFAGSQILLYIGLFMVFYGIVMGALSNDLRGMLSYSIINQVGFMVTGVGIGTEMALFGAAAHAFCHILYKCVLFMSAGSVVYMTGVRKTTELGGIFRTMKITLACGIVGAISISAFPLTSGFISKALYMEGAIDAQMSLVWFMIAAGSVGVAALTGCKFIWFVFFAKDSGRRPLDPPFSMKAGMIFVAALCILPGILPQAVYFMLPAQIEYDPNTSAHIISQLQLLLFGCLAFFLLLPLQQRTDTTTLDFDWLWRKFTGGFLLLLERAVFIIFSFITGNALVAYEKVKTEIHRWHGQEGVLARNREIGSSMLFATAMLGAFLVFYYISG